VNIRTDMKNNRHITRRYHSATMLPVIALSMLLGACRADITPKPPGYLRIKTPEKKYRMFDGEPFYRFEIPDYAVMERDTSPGAGQGWVNIDFPGLNGKIHLSYKPVKGNLGEYITDSRTLAYKHSVRAEGIEETPFLDRNHRRFGMVYDLEGNVASAVQFFITDSTTHFLRGSLYFNCTPNRDSLKPLIDFVREDIIHLIETTAWKYD
jgi:gliding motility-associated lipoprotein GldD